MKPLELCAVILIAAACSTTKDGMDEAPIACSLSSSELSARRAQLIPGLIERATEVADLDDGLRLTFASSPGLMEELARVVDQERTCCNFLHFKLTAGPGSAPVTFEVTGPPGTRELLRAL
jgi:hypothetical protein